MSGVSDLVPFAPRAIKHNFGERSMLIRILVSGCMFMFGVVLLCQGLVQNWGGLMATRFFLGVFETGMFPGCKCRYQQELQSQVLITIARFLSFGNVVHTL